MSGHAGMPVLPLSKLERIGLVNENEDVLSEPRKNGRRGVFFLDFYSSWMSILPCFRPKIGGESKRLVRERKITSWRGCDKSIEPRDSEAPVGPEQLALQFVVDDGGNDHATSVHQAPRKPIGDGYYFGASLRMGEKA